VEAAENQEKSPKSMETTYSVIPVLPSFQYQATVVRVIDADTYELSVDLGFRVFVNLEVRVRGVDSPELNTPEGQAAKKYAEGLLPTNQKVVIVTHKNRRSFTRWVADVYIGGTRSVAQVLLEAGHAVPLVM
jgi:endonuclease YncB( thermonuclease family)